MISLHTLYVVSYMQKRSLTRTAEPICNGPLLLIVHKGVKKTWKEPKSSRKCQFSPLLKEECRKLLQQILRRIRGQEEVTPTTAPSTEQNYHLSNHY